MARDGLIQAMRCDFYGTAGSAVASIVAQSALSEDTVEQVIERTSGIPLFVEELTRAVLEKDDAKPSAHEIPHTLHDSLMARLDRLGRAKSNQRWMRGESRPTPRSSDVPSGRRSRRIGRHLKS